MANQSSIRTIIGYTVDKASEAAAVQSLSAVGTANTAAVQKLNSSFASVSPRIAALRKEQAAFKADLEASIPSIQAETTAVKSLNTEFQKLADSERKRVSKFETPVSDFPTFSEKELFDDGGSSGGGLTRFGSKLRSLPSTQIPGTRIGTDAIANVIRLIGAISPAALPAIAAIGGLVAVVKVFADRASDMTSGIREITALDKTYYEARVAGTQSSIKAIIEQKQLEQKIAQARVDDLKFVALGYDELYKKTGLIAPALAGITEVAGALGAKNFKDIRDARIAYDEAKDSLKKANKELDLYNGLLGNQGVQLNTVNEEFKKFATDVANQTVASIAERANVQQGIDQLVTEGTAKELEAKKTQLEATKKNAETQLSDLKRNLDLAEKGSDAQKVYQDAFNKQLDIYNNATFELNRLSQASVEAAVKQNDAAKETIQIREDEAKATQKFVEDVRALNEKKNQSETDLWNKLTDKQVEIAQKAVEDAQKALDQLVAKEASLRLGLERALEDQSQKANFDALQSQIKFNRNEVAEAQKTRDKITDIQKKAAEDEFELGLDRSFAQLAASRRQTAQSIAQVNVEAQRGRQERLQAFADANTDAQAQFVFERQQKLEKYAQDIADAQAAESAQLKVIEQQKQKQLAAAMTAYNKEYAAIQQKYQAELTARQTAIQNELQQVAAGEAGKLQIITEYAKYAQQILAGTFNIGSVSGRAAATASGTIGGFGGAAAGISGFANRGVAAYPANFRPTGGGNTTRNQSASVSVPIIINGADPNTIIPTIKKIARDTTADAIRRMYQN